MSVRTWLSTRAALQPDASALVEGDRSQQPLGQRDFTGETVLDAPPEAVRTSPEEREERPREVGRDVRVELALPHGRHDEARGRGAACELLARDLERVLEPLHGQGATVGVLVVPAHPAPPLPKTAAR